MLWRWRNPADAPVLVAKLYHISAANPALPTLWCRWGWSSPNHMCSPALFTACMWDLSSLTRDGTQVPCIGSVESRSTCSHLFSRGSCEETARKRNYWLASCSFHFFTFLHSHSSSSPTPTSWILLVVFQPSQNQPLHTPLIKVTSRWRALLRGLGPRPMGLLPNWDTSTSPSVTGGRNKLSSLFLGFSITHSLTES